MITSLSSDTSIQTVADAGQIDDDLSGEFPDGRVTEISNQIL